MNLLPSLIAQRGDIARGFGHVELWQAPAHGNEARVEGSSADQLDAARRLLRKVSLTKLPPPRGIGSQSAKPLTRLDPMKIAALLNDEK